MSRFRIKNKPVALMIGCVFEIAFLWLLIGSLRRHDVTVLTGHPGLNNGAIEVGHVGAANMTPTVLSGAATPIRYWASILFFAAMAVILAWFIAFVARSRSSE